MSSDFSQQEHSLREQVEQSERKLDGLEAELCAIDGELEALADQHQKFDVLAKICGSLEQLDEAAFTVWLNAYAFHPCWEPGAEHGGRWHGHDVDPHSKNHTGEED